MGRRKKKKKRKKRMMKKKKKKRNDEEEENEKDSQLINSFLSKNLRNELSVMSREMVPVFLFAQERRE